MLKKMDADGHDVSGAAAEVTAMLSYIVGIGANTARHRDACSVCDG
ncbi:hypothetical protein LNO88_20250 [Klebsiella pneumoniae subsp. pneumoniae]|nr:hypothetical protein [Klebsiella pneumoniae subsp. pneumoniae]